MTSPEKKSPKVAIFLFADAFGWEILNRHTFLEDLCPHRYRLNTIFGYSSTAMPSILSGRLPTSHGHFSSFYYAPETSPFRILKWLKILPSSLTNRGRVRNLLSKILARLYGFTGYFQIYNVPFERLAYFDYAEKHDIFKPGGLIEGPSLFDHMEKHDVRYHCPDWRLSDQEQLDSLYHELAKGDITFAILHTAKLDNRMHMVGTRDPEVAKIVAWYDQEARRIWKQATQYYEDVSFYFFSDHGMADIKDSHDVRSLVENLGLNFGKDYVAFYDSTMARLWFFNDSAEQKIRAVLNDLPYGRILTEAELSEWGVDFQDKKYGHMFFLMNPGQLIVPSDMGLKRIPGMHGYQPDHVDSYAQIISNKPQDPAPFSIIDTYEMMLREAVGPEMAQKTIAESNA